MRNAPCTEHHRASDRDCSIAPTAGLGTAEHMLSTRRGVRGSLTPFGHPNKLVHDPEFDRVLAPVERVSRAQIDPAGLQLFFDPGEERWNLAWRCKVQCEVSSHREWSGVRGRRL
jgi:hypothetical protein